MALDGQCDSAVYAVMEEGNRLMCVYAKREDADKYAAAMTDPASPGRFYVREVEVIAP